MDTTSTYLENLDNLKAAMHDVLGNFPINKNPLAGGLRIKNL